MWCGATSCKRVPGHSCQEPSTKQDGAEHWQAISTSWCVFIFRLLGSLLISGDVCSTCSGGVNRQSDYCPGGWHAACTPVTAWNHSNDILNLNYEHFDLNGNSELFAFIFHFLSKMMTGCRVKSYSRSYSGENPLAWASAVMTLTPSKSGNCLLMHEISKLSQKFFSTLWEEVCVVDAR